MDSILIFKGSLFLFLQKLVIGLHDIMLDLTVYAFVKTFILNN